MAEELGGQVSRDLSVILEQLENMTRSTNASHGWSNASSSNTSSSRSFASTSKNHICLQNGSVPRDLPGTCRVSWEILGSLAEPPAARRLHMVDHLYGWSGPRVCSETARKQVDPQVVWIHLWKGIKKHSIRTETLLSTKGLGRGTLLYLLFSY